MYCKNCANPMDDNAIVCTNCGVARGQGYSYCWNCASPVSDPAAMACMNCGAALNFANSTSQQKSKMAAGLLGIFLGTFGVHNFYLGFTGKAVAQLLISVLSCGVLAIVSGIWGLVEGIMILSGSIDRDAKGVPLQE